MTAPLAARTAPSASSGQASALFAIDARSLAVLRVGLGLLILADTSARFRDWRVFFSDHGPWPSRAAEAAASWSLHRVSASPVWMLALFAAQCVAAVALALGWRTRLATIASWALLVSVHARNSLILHGADLELRLLLLWSMWLPLGGRGSLDARRDPGPAVTEVRSPASAVLLLQVALIYVTSALLKTDPAWWRSGDAVREVLSLEAHTRPFAQGLRAYPTLLRAVTYGTLALELLGPVMVFVPWRRSTWRVVVPVAFFAFHMGLALTLRLGLFPFVGVVGWTVFLPGALWDRLGRSLSTERVRASSRVADFAVIPLFALAVMCATRPWLPRLPPAPLYQLARALRLDQRWDLFAPRPLQADVWLVVPAMTADGRELDLLTGRPPDWSAPRSLRAWAPSTHWRRYYASLRRPERLDARRHFASWLRRGHERAHPGSPIGSLAVVQVTRSIHDRGALASEELYVWPERPE